MTDRRDQTFGWFAFDEKAMMISLGDCDCDPPCDAMSPPVGVVRSGKPCPNDAIPAAFEVCPTCDGKGSHVNPSIDAHGLTADDFAADPDFAESYLRGTYDQPCNECKGQRVVPRPSDQATKEQERAFYDFAEAVYQTDREHEAERRMGA